MFIEIECFFEIFDLHLGSTIFFENFEGGIESRDTKKNRKKSFMYHCYPAKCLELNTVLFVWIQAKLN